MPDTVFPQVRAIQLLMESRLARAAPSDFERRISGALLGVDMAVKQLRDALQADPKQRPYQGSALDPRRQSAKAQDIAALEILRSAEQLLPKSRRAKKAA